MISPICQIIRILICVIMIFIAVSCTKNTKNREVEYVNSNQESKESENMIISNHLPVFSITNTGGLINDNSVRIRRNPSTDAEIIGILNTDDYITIMSATEEKQIIDNSLDCWYEIKTNENITGWIFGKYVYLLKSDEPLEFANKKWLRSFGELLPKENISIVDLINCSWHSSAGIAYLIFSEKGNYAIGAPWTGAQYGVYEFIDNVVLFNPPFTYFIASVEYQIDELYYSNEMYLFGTPVLKNIDENLEFYPHDGIRPKIGEIVRINRYYCEKIWEETKINKNNILYALPDRSSINLFENDYYGNKSMEASIVKLARTIIDGIVWYYINLDFTIEPIDGGGPYFQGWLPEEYLE